MSAMGRWVYWLVVTDCIGVSGIFCDGPDHRDGTVLAANQGAATGPYIDALRFTVENGEPAANSSTIQAIPDAIVRHAQRDAA